MHKKLRGTVRAVLIFIIFCFFSCAAAAPPDLIVKFPGGEINLPGTLGLPASPAELPKSDRIAYYFTLPGDPKTENARNISLQFPPGRIPGVLLLLKGEKWINLNTELPPETPAGKPFELFLTSLTAADLQGIGIILPPGTPGRLPEIRFSSGELTGNPEGSSRIEGLAIQKSAGEKGYYEVLLSSDMWASAYKSGHWSLELKYSSQSFRDLQPDKEKTLTLETKGKKQEFDFFPKEGLHSLFFSSHQYGGIPGKIIIRGGGDFSLNSVNLSLKETALSEPPEPVTADTGTILFYPPQKWRNPDYEIFKWNLYPEIIQITSRTYAVQSLFFKRLAFYVEKPGFTGRLASDSEISALHGWNAHDYAPEDLARFFEQAREEKFPLNSYERQLLKILINNGVLKEVQDRIVPGTGAVIGTSMETSPEQRMIFMAHESIHGIYFMFPEFRKECRDFWFSLSGDEKRFWSSFLSYRGYNVDEDVELLINETATYLLQQPREETDDYFIGFITPRLLASRPQLAGWLVPYLRANPSIFSTEVENIEKRLFKLTGFTAGTIHDLLPKERSGWKIFGGLKAKWFASLDDQT